MELWEKLKWIQEQEKLHPEFSGSCFVRLEEIEYIVDMAYTDVEYCLKRMIS